MSLVVKLERQSFVALRGRKAISTLGSWWANHDRLLLRIAVSLMLVAAIVWLGYEFWRLLWQQGYWGAIDLKLRHNEVIRWFAGKSVYGELKTSVYPPATNVMLWPFLGWLSITTVRWFWAATTVGMVVWLACLVVWESKADTAQERAFMALVPLSMYATGATIGNGQLTIHLVLFLVLGLLLLYSQPLGWRKELLGGVLFLWTLAKPTVSAPFFWIIFFNRTRTAWLIALAYGGLTLFAASFQEASLSVLLRDWMTNRGQGLHGESNLQVWLASLGLKEWALPAALLALASLGFWTYRHRHVDLWLLMGVSALVARVWTYHGWYDDLLVLLPMVALFRIAKEKTSEGSALLAGVLFAITWLAMLAPGGLYLFPSPWNRVYTTGQVLVWFMVLVFLLDRARRDKCAAVG